MRTAPRTGSTEGVCILASSPVSTRRQGKIAHYSCPVTTKLVAVCAPPISNSAMRFTSFGVESGYRNTHELNFSKRRTLVNTRRLRLGERLRCSNSECGLEIIVTNLGGKETEHSLRCSCGGSMRKPYVKPAVSKVKLISPVHRTTP